MEKWHANGQWTNPEGPHQEFDLQKSISVSWYSYIIFFQCASVSDAGTVPTTIIILSGISRIYVDQLEDERSPGDDAGPPG